MRQWPPLITSDCGPEKIRPKKIILRARMCRFSPFFQLLLRTNRAAQLQPKNRRWTLVLSTVSSFVGQWVLSPVWCFGVLIPRTKNQYQCMFGVTTLGIGIQASWGITLNTWGVRGCNHIFMTSNKLMPRDQEMICPIIWFQDLGIITMVHTTFTGKEFCADF